jgi:hypothetical protein
LVGLIARLVLFTAPSRKLAKAWPVFEARPGNCVCTDWKLKVPVPSLLRML